MQKLVASLGSEAGGLATGGVRKKPSGASFVHLSTLSTGNPLDRLDVIHGTNGLRIGTRGLLWVRSAPVLGPGPLESEKGFRGP